MGRTENAMAVPLSVLGAGVRIELAHAVELAAESGTWGGHNGVHDVALSEVYLLSAMLAVMSMETLEEDERPKKQRKEDRAEEDASRLALSEAV